MQRVLVRAYDAIKEYNNMIPQWLPVGHTVLLPKNKELGDEKNYRPITCLNHIIQVANWANWKIHEKPCH